MVVDDLLRYLEQSDFGDITRSRGLIPRYLYIDLNEKDLQFTVNSTGVEQIYRKDIFIPDEERTGTAVLENFKRDEMVRMEESFGEETEYRNEWDFLREQLEGFDMRGLYGISTDSGEKTFIYGADRERYDTRFLHGFIPYRWPNHIFAEIESQGSDSHVEARYLPLEKILRNNIQKI